MISDWNSFLEFINADQKANNIEGFSLNEDTLGGIFTG